MLMILRFYLHFRQGKKARARCEQRALFRILLGWLNGDDAIEGWVDIKYPFTSDLTFSEDIFA